MAEKKDFIRRAGVEIDPETGNIVADNGNDVQVAEQPKEGSLKVADSRPGPDVHDAELEDAPVRTGRPDVPIVQTLKTGAGAHQPLSSEVHDLDGRYVGDQKEKLEAAAARDQEAAAAAPAKKS